MEQQTEKTSFPAKYDEINVIQPETSVSQILTNPRNYQNCSDKVTIFLV